MKTVFAGVGLAVALSLVACSSTEPEPELPYDQELIPQTVQTVPEGLNFLKSGDSGSMSLSCSRIGASTKCTLLWLAASGTTALSVAECVGSLGVGCGFGVLATGYAWDQFLTQPDCAGCSDPFAGTRWDGEWYRRDRSVETMGYE